MVLEVIALTGKGKKHVFVCFLTCLILLCCSILLLLEATLFCFTVCLNMLFFFFKLLSYLADNLEYYFPISIFREFLVDAFFPILLVSTQFARCLPMFVLFF